MTIAHAHGIARTVFYRKRIVETFHQVYRERLWPAFDDIMTRAIELTDAEYERLKRLYADDPSARITWEDAWEEGRSYFKELDSIRDALTNMVIAALYHLFEQQLNDFYRQVIGDFMNAVPPQPQLIRRLQGIGLDCVKFPCWETIHDLRLIANTIKHGEGASSRELVARRPRLFPSDSFAQPFVGRPLEGHGFIVRRPDDYFEAVLQFWDSITEILQTQPADAET